MAPTYSNGQEMVSIYLIKIKITTKFFKFHHYRSNEKNIIASLLKFAGYIHSHKMLPGNIFWPHFEKQDGHHGRFSTLNKDFWWPSRAKGITGRDLKFTGYVPHYKILTGNIFGLILKNKMAATGVSLQS